jgi:hypothetical protein
MLVPEIALRQHQNVLYIIGTMDLNNICSFQIYIHLTLIINVQSSDTPAIAQF